MTNKITVICHDTPFPPNHGGKLDMWNSLLLLKDFGVEVQLISWDYQELDDERIKNITNATNNHIFFQLRRNFIFRIKRFFKLFKYPWFAALRWPNQNNLQKTTAAVKNFEPDIILLHGWHGALLAFHLKHTLNIPIFYRSQNIEYLYAKNQSKHSSGLRQNIVSYISLLHLKDFEEKIIRISDIVYSISNDDTSFFKLQGFKNVKTILPFTILKSKILDINENPAFDLSFLGNLSSPNNISGIIWLIKEVMPLVWIENTNTTLLISGSNPTYNLINITNKYKNITLDINPNSANYALSSGKLYLNPTISAGGIQLKNIQMASHGRPMIARSQSLLGLPEPIKSLFTIANTADDFADAIIKKMKEPYRVYQNLSLLEKYFGTDSVKEIINDIDAQHEGTSKNLPIKAMDDRI